jgi:hypothetical protein
MEKKQTAVELFKMSDEDLIKFGENLIKSNNNLKLTQEAIQNIFKGDKDKEVYGVKSTFGGTNE